MKTIQKFLDFLVLPRETLNLIEVNAVGEDLNRYMEKAYLKDLLARLDKIKTTEHSEKVEFYRTMIKTLL